LGDGAEEACGDVFHGGRMARGGERCKNFFACGLHSIASSPRSSTRCDLRLL
jgi:hypothetical protein